MYVFDTASLSELFKFYPKRFPTLWDNFNSLISSGEVKSVTEVYKELQNFNRINVDNWLDQNKSLFLQPTNNETVFINSQLFTIKNGHFQNLMSRESILIGKPCADPFIIAKAYVNGGTVVTEEKFKPGAAKIPVACKEFKINCCSFEEFMEFQNWQF